MDALPEGYTARPATWDDGEAILEVILAADIEDVGEPDFTLGDLHADWNEPGFDLATNTQVVLDRDDTVVAYADASSGDGGAYAYAGNYTLPAHRPGGVDHWAVAWSAARAREIAREVGSDEMRTHAAPGEHRLEQLEREGFEIVRHFLRMELDLTTWEPPREGGPEGLSIAAPTLDDGPAVHAILEEAFADHWGHDPEPYASFATRHLERDDVDLDLWRLVRLDGEVVGALVARADGDGKVFVARLGVGRAARGRGVAARMLTDAFTTYRERGMARATLSVDSESLTGATRLYERVGMHRTFTVMQLRAPVSPAA